MTIARERRVDTPRTSAQSPSPSGLASWYAQGLSDELGDRLLMFDNTGGPSLELLRFRRSLTATPGFEVAVRRRVERLRRFDHPAFATVRGVEYLGSAEGLALLSNHTPGRRLSDALQQARGPAFAVSLIRQLAPALAALQQFDDGIGHCALAANRIVIAPSGRLMILEHVLGTALEQLQLPSGRFQTDLGIVLPPSGTDGLRPFDSRTDAFQLGLIALSLLLGRPVSRHESGDGLSRLLVDGSVPRDSQCKAPWLQTWLQHALQLDGQQFESSADALNAFHEMSGSGTRRICVHDDLADFKSESAGPPDGRTADSRPVALALDTDLSDSQSTVSTADRVVVDWGPLLGPATASDARQSPPVPSPAATDAGSPPHDARDNLSAASSDPKVDLVSQVALPSPLSISNSPRRRFVRAAVAALIVVAAGEAVAIVVLLRGREAPSPSAILVESVDPGSNVVVDGRVAGVTPLELRIDATTRSIRVVGSQPQVTNAARTDAPRTEPQSSRPGKLRAAAQPMVAGVAPQRSGTLRLISPIALDVLEGNRLVGSTPEVISFAAGRHDLEFVNETLGFRVRRMVTIDAGRVAHVEVAPPNGRMNINAVPWAQVWIDGRSVGETPVGNVSLPAGEHEIVFRHPDLGEHRQTALVRLDGVTRVSVNLQR